MSGKIVVFVSYRRSDEIARARRAGLRWFVVFAVAVSVALVLAAFGQPAEAARNRAPTITSAAPSVVVDEGQTATNAGSYEDPDASDVVSISSSVGNVTKTGTNSGNWTWQYATTDGGVQSQTVVITATDIRGHTARTTFGLVVNNVAPTATFNSQGSAQEDSSFEISLSNPDDTSPADKSAGFRYAFDCGDGRGFVDNGNVASKTCRAGAAGAQTVRGRISDKDGASREYDATVTVTPPPPRDLTPPDTNVTSGPEGTVRNASAAFEFASTEAGSAFECSLDGGAFADCASPWSYDQLAQGRHTFKVRALNEAGPDPTPATSAFTVDTVGPSITSVRPGGRTRDRTPAIGAVVTDAQDELVRDDIQLFVDEAEVAQFAYDGGEDRLAYTPPRLGYGGHSLKIVATDPGENTAIRQHNFRVLRPR